MFSFIETRLFTRLVLDYMTDDEYSALQTAGPVISGWGVSASFAGRRRGAASEAVTG
jgi:hypothetical protein